MQGRISNIDEVKAAIQIDRVIGRHVELKKNGANYLGLCPFHKEKSPSFNVKPSNGYFKCFGCGEGGDAIAFVQKYHRKDFYEAIEYLAEIFNVELTYETNYQPKSEEKDTINEFRAINKGSANRYIKALEAAPKSVRDYIRGRLKEETIALWQLGYAPDEWQFLTNVLIEHGKLEPAKQLGLCKTKDNRSYDAFRNRLMIPIYDLKNNIVGFGGRDLSGQKEAAKYLNSSESKLYQKSRILFGLNFAQKPIRDRKYGILVEGFLDVIKMHESGMENTVGSCGTALTDEQCILLAKETKHVIVIRDNDDAGKKALLKDIDILLRYGFKVEALINDKGKDPCDLASQIEGKELEEHILNRKIDAVIYKADSLLVNSEDPDELSAGIRSVAEMLRLIEDDVKRDAYIQKIAKAKKFKPKLIEAHIEKLNDQEEKVQVLKEGEHALPGWVQDKDQFFQDGFVARVDGYHTGYYFGSATSKLTRLTNFVLKPLFHIYSKQDNKRMVEVTNGRSTKILEMPSKAMISLDQFRTALFDEGHFVTEGGFTQSHLLKLVGKYGDQFPLCWELKTLGWQPEGFWAYSNYAFADGILKRFDDMGIVEIGDKRFLSLSASNAQADVRSEEDIYENDRYLSYKQPSITFADWADLMVRTYEQNGWMGIAFSMITIFRDIVVKSQKIPHLYAYGAVQTGKSEFGESISNLFFNRMPPFNLNQGTDFAFFCRMERFRNCPNALNEFDENAIKEEWFRALKAAHDGEGREKGRGGKEGKTRTQKIECTLVLMGQYLSTKDDSSVLSRCIPLAFREKNNRPEEQIQAYRTLKSYEDKGISGVLVELLKLRDIVSKQYADTLQRLQRRLTDEFQKEGKSIKIRILKNISAPMAMIELLSDHIKLPFTSEQFYSYGKGLIDHTNSLVSESNSLADFWRTVEFLLDRTEIAEGIDFRIETLNSVTVYGEKDQSFQKELGEAKKLLFLRLNTVHVLYSDVYKRKTNKPSINLDTIRMYLKEQSYYVGTSPGTVFKTKDGKRTNTTCLILEYDKLPISLERLTEEEMYVDDRKEITVKGRIYKDAQMIGGALVATIVTTKTEGFPAKTETLYYKCYFVNIADSSGFTNGTAIEVTGLLTERISGKKDDKRIFRQIDVTSFVFSEANEKVPAIEDLPF